MTRDARSAAQSAGRRVGRGLHRDATEPVSWPCLTRLRVAVAVVGAVLLTGCGGAPYVTVSPPAPPIPSPSALPSPTISASACHLRGQLPDPVCTPGAIDPRVTQANIHQTICVSGYTKTVRPPATYTHDLKVKGIKDYAYTDTVLAHYEEDHLIPLELGGAPSDPRNLWPEPGVIPNPKDGVENTLHSRVCSGSVLLATAQQAIARDWTTALR